MIAEAPKVFPQQGEWKRGCTHFVETARHILKNGKGKRIRIVRVDNDPLIGRKEIYGRIEKHEFHNGKQTAIKLHIKTEGGGTEFFTLPLVSEFEPTWWGRSLFISVQYEG